MKTKPPIFRRFSKQEIDKMVKLLKKHKSVSISNLCTVELKRFKKPRRYLDLNTGKMKTKKAGSYRINLKKALYLKSKIKSL